MTTNKTTTDGPISPRLRRRRQDQGGDRYRDRFFGGVKGDVKGNDEVDFDDFGDPHPPTHLDFLTLTAAVTGIISYGAAIENTDGQPHRPGLLRRRIIVTAPTPPHHPLRRPRCPASSLSPPPSQPRDYPYLPPSYSSSSIGSVTSLRGCDETRRFAAIAEGRTR